MIRFFCIYSNMNSPSSNKHIIEDGYVMPDGRTYLVEKDAGFFSIELNKDVLKENFEFDESQPLILMCLLQRAEGLNRNGRVYPFNVLKKVADKYNELIVNRQAIGERDHPESGSLSLVNISHEIKEMFWKGNDLYGKIELLTSPGYHKMGVCSLPGDQIAEYIRKGIKLGISSRGLGSLKNENKILVVQDDYELIGFDIVATPSTHGAYLYTSDKFDEVMKSKSNEVAETKLPSNDLKYENLRSMFKNFLQSK